jgi:hypothetical protein
MEQRALYQDETDLFFTNPSSFIHTYFTKNQSHLSVPHQLYSIPTFSWASHVVLFESTWNGIKDVLESQGYHLVSNWVDITLV